MPEARNNDRNLFRCVRQSKFRHVYGTSARKDQCYDNVNITKNAHDSNFCAVNPKFLAIVTESCGGGSFAVIPIENVGRFDALAGRVTGHTGQIYDIKWCPFNDNVIASGSDDCTVKVWHIPDKGLSRHMNDPLVVLRGVHTRRVAYVEWHPTADNILLSVGLDHKVVVWNIARAEVVVKIDCHPDVIHSLSFNRNGSHFATTCKDKRIRIIETRTGRVVREGDCHQGTKASKVAFLGDTEKLFTVGFSRYSDRQYAVWNAKDLSLPLAIENIDSSSGVLFPFYDHDTRMVYIVGKGDGNVRYYEMTDEQPYCHYLSQFISGAPQRGVGWMPKRGCDFQKCEIARFYKLHAIKPVCEPISMIVPRKSEIFQADIYTPTAAPVAAMTADQFIAGETRNPILCSLNKLAEKEAKTNKPVMLPTFVDNTKVVSNAYTNKLQFISQVGPIDYRNPQQQEEDRAEAEALRAVHSHKPVKSTTMTTKRAFLTQDRRSFSGSKLPWVKYDDDDIRDYEDAEETNSDSDAREDYHQTKMRNTPKNSSKVQEQNSHEDSDDSFAHTTDESLTEEYAFSSINSATSSNGSSSSLAGSKSSSSNAQPQQKQPHPTTLESSKIDDLIDAHFALNPKNERELWSAFQEQRAIIHKLIRDLEERNSQCTHLQTQIDVLEAKLDQHSP